MRQGTYEQMSNSIQKGLLSDYQNVNATHNLEYSALLHRIPRDNVYMFLLCLQKTKLLHATYSVSKETCRYVMSSVLLQEDKALGWQSCYSNYALFKHHAFSKNNLHRQERYISYIWLTIINVFGHERFLVNRFACDESRYIRSFIIFFLTCSCML